MNGKSKAITVKLLRRELTVLQECKRNEKRLVARFWEDASPYDDTGAFYKLNIYKFKLKQTTNKVESIVSALKYLKGLSV